MYLIEVEFNMDDNIANILQIMYTDIRTGLQLLNVETNEKRKIMST